MNFHRDVVARAAAAFALPWLASASAFAAEPSTKGIFDRLQGGEPFTLMIERPGSIVDITSLAILEDGRTWICGYVEDLGGSFAEGYLALLDQDGAIEMEKTYSLGDTLTHFWWVADRAGGGVAVAAVLEQFTEATSGAVALIDDAGRVEHSVGLADLGYDYGEIIHVAMAPDGGMVITGAAANHTGAMNILVSRLNPDRTQAWSEIVSARADYLDIWGYQSVVLHDGGVVSLGNAADDTLQNVGLVTRFDAAGNMVWQQWADGQANYTHKQAAYVYANWLAVLEGGDIAYVLTEYDRADFVVAARVVRVAPDGRIVFQTELRVGGEANPITVAGAANGDILIAGDLLSPQRPFVSRVDGDGRLLWSTELDIGLDAYAWAIEEAEDGSIVVVGGQYGDASGSAGWVARLTADGEADI